jgi:hypothetical protein
LSDNGSKFLNSIIEELIKMVVCWHWIHSYVGIYIQKKKILLWNVQIKKLYVIFVPLYLLKTFHISLPFILQRIINASVMDSSIGFVTIRKCH